MHHEPTGFSAGLIVLPTANTFASRAVQPELCISAPSDIERVAWIETLPDAPLRVFFAREECLKPIRGLEVFASYLFCPGATPWVKIYATGEGVAPCASQWCMHGRFGPEATDLRAVTEACISLKIYACELLPGTELGNGLLYTKDVAVMNREHPLVVFTWQYASREQLAQLGVLPGAGPSQLDAHALYSPLSTSLAFLRLSNQLAISLMRPSQRAQLADALARSRDVLALLPPHAQAELERYRRTAARAPEGTREGESAQGEDEGKEEEEEREEEREARAQTPTSQGPATRSRSAPNGARKSYAAEDDDDDE